MKYMAFLRKYVVFVPSGVECHGSISGSVALLQPLGSCNGSGATGEGISLAIQLKKGE